MEQESTNKIAYLSAVFTSLPTEKKDNLLDTARKLLEIQENEVIFAKNTSTPQGEQQGIV